MMKEKRQKVDGLQCRMPPTSTFAFTFVSLKQRHSLQITR